MTLRESKPTIRPVEFIRQVIRRNEKGEPWSLATYHDADFEV